VRIKLCPFDLQSLKSLGIIFQKGEMTEERRKCTRFPFREDIIIDGTSLCSSTDISEGGLYVSAIQHFDQNSIVDVTLPFKGQKITFKARVQYCQPGIGMGLMFVNLNSEQRAILKELLESAASRSF
jgi:hypothetical protein